MSSPLTVNICWNMLMLLIVQVYPVQGGNAEGQLLKNLFAKYSRQGRPVTDHTQPVLVEINVNIHEVIELNEQHELLRSIVWIQKQWKDEFLTWDPTQYDGVDSISVSAAEIWTPDVYIYNLVGEATNRAATVRGLVREDLVIYHNGGVLDYMPLQLDTRCNPDLIFFPFDVQTCPIELMSFTLADHRMKMYPGNRNEYYGVNGAWVDIQISITTFTKHFPVNQNFTTLVAHITMRRNPIFYMINIVIPVFSMGLVVLLSLLLPVESEERLTVGLTAFMTYSFFALVMSKIIPPSANPPPVLCAFLGVNMILTLVIIAWNVFTIRIQYNAATWRLPCDIFTCKKVTEIGNRVTASDLSGDRNEQENATINDANTSEGKRQLPAKLESNEAMKKWKRVSDVGDKSLACIFSITLVTELCFFAFLTLSS